MSANHKTCKTIQDQCSNPAQNQTKNITLTSIVDGNINSRNRSIALNTDQSLFPTAIFDATEIRAAAMITFENVLVTLTCGRAIIAAQHTASDAQIALPGWGLIRT